MQEVVREFGARGGERVGRTEVKGMVKILVSPSSVWHTVSPYPGWSHLAMPSTTWRGEL